MNISENSGYNAVMEGTAVLRMCDSKSVFKIYYVSIEGRPEPERFDWKLNSLSKEDFEKEFLAGGWDGVGFVTAFPHIAKVFRYSPKSEVLMLVKAFNPQTGAVVDLDRGEGYTEFACLAEAVIAAEEYGYWAEAGTVEEYLSRICSLRRLPVQIKDKMKRYWE